MRLPTDDAASQCQTAPWLLAQPPTSAANSQRDVRMAIRPLAVALAVECVVSPRSVVVPAGRPDHLAAAVALPRNPLSNVDVAVGAGLGAVAVTAVALEPARVFESTIGSSVCTLPHIGP